MCGVVGIIHNGNQYYQSIARAMMDTIKHRGPADDGIYAFDNCVLGHVRLSIVDIANGKQPMINENKGLGVVFNGEIYGYRDIKSKLSRQGWGFQTNSDTEVLLALYQKYGDEMLKHLPGMFGFALWDDNEKLLLCARDRFGEKPFYYAEGEKGEFIFASEIKAILATGLVKPQLDLDQVWHFLNYSYVYPTRTMYKNIHALPPAHKLVWKDGKICVERYWDLPKTNLMISENEAVEEFTRLFKQAVQRQLVADVPVGAFLSGGLDSGSVVAVASQFVPKLTTVSFSFRDGVDESKIARSMAERYNTNHIEIRDIDFDVSEMLYKMQSIFDEPFADPAAIPAYLIAKEARKYAKVVLTGDAGDELLGGYDRRYRALWYMRRYSQNRYSNFSRKMYLKHKYFLLRGRRKLRRCLSSMNRNNDFLMNTDIRDTEIQLSALNILAEDSIVDIVNYTRQKGRMLSDELGRYLGLKTPDNDYLIREGFLQQTELDNALRVDIMDYLPGNGFLKTDRTTMAVSLESRTPFCDVDLAEFCISLPFDLKVRGREDKYILRKSMQDMWTPAVKKCVKNGFSPPFSKWLQEKKVVEMKQHLLHDRKSKLFEILNFDGVQKVCAENHVWPVWSLLQLALWLDTHPYEI